MVGVPELPDVSGAELREWLTGGGPDEFSAAVRAWSDTLDHPENPILGPTTLFPVLNVLGWVWPWSPKYRALREFRDSGYLPEDVSPVTDLVDALAEVDRARAAKREPGGRQRVSDALARADELQAAADADYARMRAQAANKLAEVAARTRPARSGPPAPQRMPVTIH